ncbi:MAG: helix-turn-helix transcriptional regulator [Methylotenera sp.]|nr:helix-turn-helix transcriptional regulator [Oligoflexia bacterium]
MKKKRPSTVGSLAELSARILQERHKRGITLQALASEMKISKGNLSDIERGKRDPRFSTLQSIAHGLGVPLARLVKDF